MNTYIDTYAMRDNTSFPSKSYERAHFASQLTVC